MHVFSYCNDFIFYIRDSEIFFVDQIQKGGKKTVPILDVIVILALLLNREKDWTFKKFCKVWIDLKREYFRVGAWNSRERCGNSEIWIIGGLIPNTENVNLTVRWPRNGLKP